MTAEHGGTYELPEGINRVESARFLSSVVTAEKPIENFGPFRTKSEADLRVLFAFWTLDELRSIFHYDDRELARVEEDIRGFRIYEISGLRVGTIGGTEFHRIRKEIITVSDGSIVLYVEDLWGDLKEFVLGKGDGVWIPPYIKHTYETREDSTRLVVVANTLFDPSNSQTFDTYSDEEFSKLKDLLGR